VNDISFVLTVIPERGRQPASPESIATNTGVMDSGLLAFARPRNDRVLASAQVSGSSLMNLPLLAGPVGLAQLALEDLSGRIARQCVDEID